jgi:predicted O-methyltransferase YrrM
MKKISDAISIASRPFRGQRDNLSYDAIALHHLRPLLDRFDYLPWPRPSMRPAAVLALVNDIVINNRSHIVECGAGISTLLCAAALEHVDGFIVSVDESADWLRFVEGKLSSAKLSHRVQLVHAERTILAMETNDREWYSWKKFESALGDMSIDLLVVDGPAAYGRDDREIRFPALPMLHSRLSERCCVVLDDAGREGEKRIMEKWSDLLGFGAEDLQIVSGTYVWNRGSRFYPGL